jgi:hypothetical protein
VAAVPACLPRHSKKSSRLEGHGSDHQAAAEGDSDERDVVEAEMIQDRADVLLPCASEW